VSKVGGERVPRKPAPALPSQAAIEQALRAGRDPVTAVHLQRWLDDYLPHDAPRPSDEALGVLAQEINFIAERPGGARDPILEERSWRFMGVRYAASNFRAKFADYAELFASGEAARENPTFAAADELFDGMGVSNEPHTQALPRRGRPEASWHQFGHRIADMISTVMRTAGHKGGLSKKQENSVTAVIGAEVMRHLLHVDIQAAGFAAAMRRRQRRQRFSPKSAAMTETPTT
jgi:hypothetical protein